ncbi:MAG: hypothetical protein IKE03_02985, partial [Blautia sp.]|nr:hypothetical protein [Blautia sp.]
MEAHSQPFPVFFQLFILTQIVTVQSQAPSQLRGQAQAPFVALEVRLALAVDLLFHAPRSKCEVLTE